MSKSKRYKPSPKCPDPINTFLDIAGAVTLGAYTKHKILKDYEKGHGAESIQGATTVFGFGAMRRGSSGLINLGGLYGVRSALNEIDKREKSSAYYRPVYTRVQSDRYDQFTTYKPINNKYAWRLNCEDGSDYGVYPEDYETRDEYNLALHVAKYHSNDDIQPRDNVNEDAEINMENEYPVYGKDKQYVLCKVSRLDNGENLYYLSENINLSVGDTVIVPSDEQFVVIGVVLSVAIADIDSLPEDIELI